ncbi:MAG: hypothetical protein GWN86_00470 [Desulfobacterales bacterium]|nr:hypothetical protein [Desulfobacterales bacterium]
MSKEDKDKIEKARLGNMKIAEVSLVDKAANNRKFLFYKRANGGAMSKDKSKAVDEAIKAVVEGMKQLSGLCKEGEITLSSDQKELLTGSMGSLPFGKDDSDGGDGKGDDKDDKGDKGDDKDDKGDDKGDKGDKGGDSKASDDKGSSNDNKDDDKGDNKDNNKEDAEELAAMEAVASGLAEVASDLAEDSN